VRENRPPMARDPRIERGLLAQLTERRRRVDAGEQPLGWKLGFGTAPAMQSLGISEPLVGYLLKSGQVETGAEVDLSGWANPRLEPEIAVHLGSALGGDPSRDEAQAAIAGLGAAIELVDPDPAEKDPEAILAGDIFQRHTILGPVVADADPGAVSARIARSGEEVAATGDATELTGDPIELVRHVARTLAVAGERIEAGDVVICGSVVPAIEVAPGDEVEVALEPLGTLKVRFR
jgi:2-keto-4-pentenoate hydratase